MELVWKGPDMMGHVVAQQVELKVLWHSSGLHRLRFVSFVAESFWKLAFGGRRGLNGLLPSSVPSVKLSDVKVVGSTELVGEVEFAVGEVDAALALKIARAAVVALEDLSYRVLDAVVPDTDKDGKYSEHDLLVERRGQPGTSSVEVKCKTIKKPAVRLHLMG